MEDLSQSLANDEARRREENELRAKIASLEASISTLRKVSESEKSNARVGANNLVAVLKELLPSTQGEGSRAGAAQTSLSSIVSALLPTTTAPTTTTTTTTVASQRPKHKDLPAPKISLIDVSENFQDQFQSLPLSLTSSASHPELGPARQRAPADVVAAHTVVLHDPHFLFSAVVRVQICLFSAAASAGPGPSSSQSPTIRAVRIDWIPGWAREELGDELDRAAAGRDVEGVFRILNGYWSMLIHRAYCWACIFQSVRSRVISITSATHANGRVPVQISSLENYRGTQWPEKKYFEALSEAYDLDDLLKLITTRDSILLYPPFLTSSMRDEQARKYFLFKISWHPRLNSLTVLSHIQFNTPEDVECTPQLNEARHKFIKQLEKTFQFLDYDLPQTLQLLYGATG